MPGLRINLTTLTRKHGIGILLLTKEIITIGIEIDTITIMFLITKTMATIIITTKTMLSNLIHYHLSQLSFQIENQLN